MWARYVGLLGLGSGTIYGMKMLISPVKIHSFQPVENVPAIESEGENVDLLSDMELKCVQVFFRHGARTPIRSMPDIEEVVIHIIYFLFNSCQNETNTMMCVFHVNVTYVSKVN